MKKIKGGICIQNVKDYFKRTDLIYWLLTLTASVYGCLLIASQQRGGEVNFLRTQIMAVVIGYTAAVIISLIDYNFIAKCWWLISGVALALTCAVFFIGIQVAGTDDVGWIRLPGGMTFQPSELTKICFIVTFSKHIAYLTEKDRLHSFIGVMTLILHAAVPIGLIHLQGDDGAALVFACMFLIMTFAAGVQLRYFIIFFVCAAAAIPFVWSKVMNSDQQNRLAVLFSNDDEMMQTFGWQQYQGKVSIASGGLFGKGLFAGPRVERDMVPYQENDFIFTVAGEELGLIGCAAILLLFILLLAKTFRTSVSACNTLGKSICIGFFALLAVQITINLGMVLGLLPVVGITLPFFSSGGSSAACLYLGVGLVQSVYMHPTDDREKPVKVEISKTIQGSIFPA
ncbi:MAG: FtsW/RodA/SpoVE family cell cycle protein [Clostridia bacterium]|nr:FtsW/RodA/SpoVE family cell cycle protein [Clostridia bacterium]